MSDSLEKLISIAGDPLASEQEISTRELSREGMPVELANLLRIKNGFLAFESALRIFPIGHSETSYSLEQWNRYDLWRRYYDLFPSNCLCFGEDIFGIQFCIAEGMIVTFDPETGDFKKFSNNLEEWAFKILEDYEYVTGYPFAHDWQIKHGALKPKHRLIPATPFVCGGEFKIDNLLEIESVKGMKFRAELARQIRDLPDGATIKFKIVP